MTSTQTVTGNQQIGIGLLARYLVLHAGMLFAMYRTDHFDPVEPLLVLTILGLGFSLAAWMPTTGIHPLYGALLEPKRELGIIGAYLSSRRSPPPRATMSGLPTSM